MKKIHTELFFGDDFQRKAEAKIENEEVPGQKDLGWQMVRKRKREKKAEEGQDSVCSVNLIRFDSLSQGVGRRKRQRTESKEIDGREKQEHHKKNKITDEKTDDDEKNREKDVENETCVIAWNVKSPAQYDFLCDMAQCQANVVMFQETPKRQPDGMAEGLGWALLKEQKKGTAAIAVRRQNMGLLRYSCTSKKWALVVLGSILLLSMYLLHTWRGELNLESTRRR